MVTDEAGMGSVPTIPPGRLSRDTFGDVNQRLAQVSDHVYVMVAGTAKNTKGVREELSVWVFIDINKPS